MKKISCKIVHYFLNERTNITKFEFSCNLKATSSRAMGCRAPNPNQSARQHADSVSSVFSLFGRQNKKNSYKINYHYKIKQTI